MLISCLRFGQGIRAIGVRVKGRLQFWSFNDFLGAFQGYDGVRDLSQYNGPTRLMMSCIPKVSGGSFDTGRKPRKKWRSV